MQPSGKPKKVLARETVLFFKSRNIDFKQSFGACVLKND